MADRAQSGLAGIVLAAGASDRLGEPKQLLVWQSKTLLATSVEKLLPVCGAGVTVVIGAYGDEVAAAISDYPLQIACNQDWQAGMSSSLRCGLEAVARTDAVAAVIMLCDQPLVLDHDIDRLVNRWLEDQYQPVATRYNNGKGVPAILPVAGFGELTKVSGDRGARQFVSDLPEDRLVTIDGAEFDVDTADDLARLMQITKSDNTG